MTIARSPKGAGKVAIKSIGHGSHSIPQNSWFVVAIIARLQKNTTVFLFFKKLFTYFTNYQRPLRRLLVVLSNLRQIKVKSHFLKALHGLDHRFIQLHRHVICQHGIRILLICPILRVIDLLITLEI